MLVHDLETFRAATTNPGLQLNVGMVLLRLEQSGVSAKPSVEASRNYATLMWRAGGDRLNIACDGFTSRMKIDFWNEWGEEAQWTEETVISGDFSPRVASVLSRFHDSGQG